VKLKLVLLYLQHE